MLNSEFDRFSARGGAITECMRAPGLLLTGPPSFLHDSVWHAEGNPILWAETAAESTAFVPGAGVNRGAITQRNVA